MQRLCVGWFTCPSTISAGEETSNPSYSCDCDLLMLSPFSRFLVALIAAASITRCDKTCSFFLHCSISEKSKKLPVASRRMRFSFFWHVELCLSLWVRKWAGVCLRWQICPSKMWHGAAFTEFRFSSCLLWLSPAEKMNRKIFGCTLFNYKTPTQHQNRAVSLYLSLLRDWFPVTFQKLMPFRSKLFSFCWRKLCPSDDTQD